jgi:hypothetical protein
MFLFLFLPVVLTVYAALLLISAVWPAGGTCNPFFHFRF